VWIWLTRDFAAAIPSLTTRSIGPLASLNDPDKGVTPQESTALITKNYPSLKEDLQLLIKLMHIARNLLVVPEPEIPQDLCAAAQFDQMLYQTIILCINVTSKAYDGDVLEEAARLKLSEITELCKLYFSIFGLLSLTCFQTRSCSLHASNRPITGSPRMTAIRWPSGLLSCSMTMPSQTNPTATSMESSARISPRPKFRTGLSGIRASVTRPGTYSQTTKRM
jgi:hypothetical protein